MALTIAKLPTIHNRSVGDIGCYLIHDSSITSGIPDTANVANPGSGYHVSDVITIVGGNNDATFRVDTIFGSGSVPYFDLGGQVVCFACVLFGDVIQARAHHLAVLRMAGHAVVLLQQSQCRVCGLGHWLGC